MREETPIGEVFAYYPQTQKAVLELFGSVFLGQTLHFTGLNGDFRQTLDYMLVAEMEVGQAYKGDFVTIQVVAEVKKHDKVFLEREY